MISGVGVAGDVGDRVRSASWGMSCMAGSRKRAKIVGTFVAGFICRTEVERHSSNMPIAEGAERTNWLIKVTAFCNAMLCTPKGTEMHAVYSFKKLLPIYETTRHHIPEDTRITPATTGANQHDG